MLPDYNEDLHEYSNVKLSFAQPVPDSPNTAITRPSPREAWQRQHEPSIFRTLLVYSDELAEFADVVSKIRRLNHIRHLHFHCRLLPYELKDFDTEEPSTTARINELRFEDAIKGLFRILAKWEGPNIMANMTLELSAGSAGDNLHRISSF